MYSREFLRRRHLYSKTYQSKLFASPIWYFVSLVVVLSLHAMTETRESFIKNFPHYYLQFSVLWTCSRRIIVLIVKERKQHTTVKRYQFQTFRFQIYVSTVLLSTYSVLAGACTVVAHDSAQNSAKTIFLDDVTPSIFQRTGDFIFKQD